MQTNKIFNNINFIGKNINFKTNIAIILINKKIEITFFFN